MKLSILLVLSAALNVGCAAKKLVIQNADLVMEQQIQKHLPLYSKQKKELSKDVDRFLNDHKVLAEKAIPVIDEINLENHGKINVQYDYLLDIYKVVAIDLSKIMAKHMANLDQKQQQEFFENLDEDNMQISKKTPKDRMEELFDRFEKLFGSISEEQKDILKQYKDYFIKRQTDRLYNRLELHKKFRDVYANGGSVQSKKNSFIEAFKTYQDKSLEKSENLQIIKKILPTLSVEQRESFREKIQEVKDMIKYFLSIEF